MKQRSLFDVISPIMTGPSSSHTAGAVRLGLMARNIYADNYSLPQKITFRLYNSFAQTGLGHGSDKGLLSGFLGYSVDSNKIKNIFELPETKNLNYSFEFEQNFDRHPNSVDFIIRNKTNMKISGNSVGAGNIEIIKINEFDVKLSGEFNTLIMFYKDKPGMISKVSSIIQDENINIASLECGRNSRGETASMSICLDSSVSSSIINKIKLLEDIYFVRNIKKLEG